MTKSSKIIFAGLDRAGKTSLLNTLQKKFSALNDPAPTRSYRRQETEINFMGLNIVSWDLGGQQRYRNEYFKKKYRVFSNTSTLFYVVDVQDPERFDEAAEYFNNIMRTFTSLDLTPTILILFNKVDPDIQGTPEINERIENFKNSYIKDKYDFQKHYYETSIHDPSTMIKAFSDGVIKKTPKSQLINKALKNFSQKTFASALVIFDKNILIVGSHFSNPLYLEMVEMVSPRFILAMEALQRYSVTPQNVIVNVDFDEIQRKEEPESAILFVRQFKIHDARESTFYLAILSRNERTFSLCDNLLPLMAEQLENLLDELQM